MESIRSNDKWNEYRYPSKMKEKGAGIYCWNAEQPKKHNKAAGNTINRKEQKITIDFAII